MRSIGTIILFMCIMISMPTIAFAESNDYLDESTGLQLNWEYTETAPKRPLPKLLNSDNYSFKWKIDDPLMFDLVQDQNGILYTTDSNDNVKAVYPNGKEKWSVYLDMGLELTTIHLKIGMDGTIYAYDSDSLSQEGLTTIYALSSEGQILWKLQSTTIYSQYDIQFAGDSLGNFVYFSDEGLVSRNKNGEINWVNEDITTSNSKYYLDNSHSSNVYTDPQGNIYVDSSKKEIISLDPSGTVRWRSQPQDFLDDYNVFQPFFSDDRLIYMLTADGLHGMNTNDGSIVKITRQSDLTDIQSSGIPTDGNGGYYIALRGVIQKIDYKGKPFWSYVPRSTEKYGVGSMDSLTTDDYGNVYFPTGVGNIIGLNSEGKEMFAFLRNAFWHKITEIVVGKNGNIYSTNHDIGLVAFGPKQIQVYSDHLFLPMTVTPIKNNGTVLVPFRSLFEHMGLTVDWDSATKTITGSKEGLTITLSIGSKTAYVNGQSKQLTEAPKIADNSSFVPLRFIGEALGKKVSWDGTGSFVNIESP